MEVSIFRFKITKQLLIFDSKTFNFEINFTATASYIVSLVESFWNIFSDILAADIKILLLFIC